MTENDEPKNQKGVPLCPNCPHVWHGLRCNIWCECPTSCRNLIQPDE